MDVGLEMRPTVSQTRTSRYLIHSALCISRSIADEPSIAAGRDNRPKSEPHLTRTQVIRTYVGNKQHRTVLAKVKSLGRKEQQVLVTLNASYGETLFTAVNVINAILPNSQ